MQILKAETLLCCLLTTLDLFAEFISLQISITFFYTEMSDLQPSEKHHSGSQRWQKEKKDQNYI